MGMLIAWQALNKSKTAGRPLHRRLPHRDSGDDELAGKSNAEINHYGDEVLQVYEV